jgi:hypothetical protein
MKSSQSLWTPGSSALAQGNEVTYTICQFRTDHLPFRYPQRQFLRLFPNTREWWPSWDPRKQFDCLQTCMASENLAERILCTLGNGECPPAERDQKYVLEQCRKWNLVWVGRDKVAPLEPHEMELLLGYPKDHTRGIGRTEVQIARQFFPSRHCCIPPLSTKGHFSARVECSVLVFGHWRSRGRSSQIGDNNENCGFS